VSHGEGIPARRLSTPCKACGSLEVTTTTAHAADLLDALDGSTVKPGDTVRVCGNCGAVQGSVTGHERSSRARTAAENRKAASSSSSTARRSRSKSTSSKSTSSKSTSSKSTSSPRTRAPLAPPAAAAPRSPAAGGTTSPTTTTTTSSERG
jgi:hypothetical protein